MSSSFVPHAAAPIVVSDKKTHYAVRFSLDALRDSLRRLKADDARDVRVSPDAVRALMFCAKSLNDASDVGH